MCTCLGPRLLCFSTSAPSLHWNRTMLSRLTSYNLLVTYRGRYQQCLCILTISSNGAGREVLPVKIPVRQHQRYCPVIIIQQYYYMRPKEVIHLFTNIDSTRFRESTILRVLRSVLEVLKLDILPRGVLNACVKTWHTLPGIVLGFQHVGWHFRREGITSTQTSSW